MNDDPAPPVTVLMPVYNTEAFIAEAIRSVLDQTYTDFELLIVDDGSTDGSAEIVRSFSDPRLRFLVSDINSGIVSALNRGLAEARGELIARIDSDDMWLSHFLSESVGLLADAPKVGLVGAPDRIIGERGKRIPNAVYRARTAEGIRFQMLFRNPFVHSAVVYRRALAVDRLGGYDPTMAGIEDLDLWVRLLTHCEPAMLARPGVLVRERSGSISSHVIRQRRLTSDPRFGKCVGLLDRYARVMLGQESDVVSPFVVASSHLQMHRALSPDQPIVKPVRDAYRTLVSRPGLNPEELRDMNRVMVCFLAHGMFRLAVRQRRFRDARLFGTWSLAIKPAMALRTFLLLLGAECRRRLVRYSGGR